MDATLIINRFDSRCSACGHGADPYEKRHKTMLGHGKRHHVGCGATFTSSTSDYIGMSERVSEMRPDLTWIGETLF